MNAGSVTEPSSTDLDRTRGPVVMGWDSSLPTADQGRREMTDRDQLRREELNSSLSDIRSRIVRARESSGRTDTVDLLVVTKTFPASDVEILADLGVRDVGENRDQEAKAKKLEVHARDLRWHMIGRLQRNKAGSVARWADIVESVDRMALSSATRRRGCAS
jgi:PLP dependent protein